MSFKQKYLAIIGLIGTVFLFTGCTRKSNQLYYWGDYEENLYNYYQIEKASPVEQIASLNSIIEKAKSTDQSVPPGLHAQLGMLYANSGQRDKALEQFKIEKTLFPESTQFIEFITQKYQGKKR